ncbi:MAG: hypothetical protein AAFP98_07865 [Pseudomonadota bacterium]
MTGHIINTAEDMIEERIYAAAPFYYIKVNSGLVHRMQFGCTGKIDKPRWSADCTPKLLDARTNARWDPVLTGLEHSEWADGHFSIDNPNELVSYNFGIDYPEAEEALIPDMFVTGGLNVSERAKDVIEKYAPGTCYFAPLSIVGKATGEPHPQRFYSVHVRTIFAYWGQSKTNRPMNYPSDYIVFDHRTWHAFCQNDAIQARVASVPIFLFDRNAHCPVLSHRLLGHLKANGISGLLETTEFGQSAPHRHPTAIPFETVFPLDPMRPIEKQQSS